MDPFTLLSYLALGVALVAAGRLLFRARSAGAPTPVAAAGAAAFLTGLLTLVLASLHLAAVAGGALGRLLGLNPAPFAYDFRLYSLFLVGVVIASTGFRLLSVAGTAARGEPEGRAAARRATVLLLAVLIPLLPIQPGFAGGLSAFALVTLAALLLAPRAVVVPHAPATPAGAPAAAMSASPISRPEESP